MDRRRYDTATGEPVTWHADWQLDVRIGDDTARLINGRADERTAP
jgi:hypothetical protein